MDADTSARFINSVVKSIQSVCHGYVEFNDHIKVIGHLYLSVDSNVNLNYIVNEQVCKNDRESSTMFVSNSYHSEPPSKKTVERDRRRLAGPRSKQDIRESETRVAVPSELGHVESDVMLFAAENFPSNSNTDSFQFTSQPHRPQGASKRKRTLSGGAELGAGGASAVTDVEVQIAGLIDQDLAGGSERTGSKARRLSEGDSRVPDNGQDVASFTLSEGGIPSAESGAGDWDVSGGPSTSNRDPMQESLSSRPGPSATITRAPSTDHSKDSNPPSRAPSTPSVKEEPQVDVDLTIVKEEEAPPSQSSCMQSGKGSSSQSLSGASNANYSSGQWDLPSHLQQQQQEMHSRVMRLDPNSSTVEYSSPPGASTSQAPDPGGLNMLDNAQLYPVMLHPNTATSQDIMSAVSMVEGRSMGQTLPSVMSFSNAGAIPSTSGHRMDMGPKPGGPRPGRLPRSMADQYGMVSLSEMRDVYVYPRQLLTARDKDTASGCASYLLSRFFTNAEMLGSNLTGAHSKRMLDPAVIAAIIEFTLSQFPGTQETALKRAMRNRITAAESYTKKKIRDDSLRRFAMQQNLSPGGGAPIAPAVKGLRQ